MPVAMIRLFPLLPSHVTLVIRGRKYLCESVSVVRTYAVLLNPLLVMQFSATGFHQSTCSPFCRQIVFARMKARDEQRPLLCCTSTHHRSMSYFPPLLLQHGHLHASSGDGRRWVIAISTRPLGDAHRLTGRLLIIIVGAVWPLSRLYDRVLTFAEKYELISRWLLRRWVEIGVGSRPEGTPGLTKVRSIEASAARRAKSFMGYGRERKHDRLRTAIIFHLLRL